MKLEGEGRLLEGHFREVQRNIRYKDDLIPSGYLKTGDRDHVLPGRCPC